MTMLRTLALAGAVAGAGAVAWHEYEDRAMTARLDDGYKIQRLYDLRHDTDALRYIQDELSREWGAFGPQDLGEMEMMTKNAGKMMFVISGEDGVPLGLLQTGLADVHGNPYQLVEKYPSFNAITSGGTWTESQRMYGDTALLLQITSFGERSGGVGSTLRNASLYLLDNSVKYALTTTPVDTDPSGVCLEEPKTYTPSMKFHNRGGAEPTIMQENYKVPVRYGESNHGTSIVFMKYTRNDDGTWNSVRQPGMTVTREPFGRKLSSDARQFGTMLQKARTLAYSFSRA